MKRYSKNTKLFFTLTIVMILFLPICVLGVTVKGLNGYIFPESNKKLIKNEELKYTDSFTQLLAKNELFARLGYVFKDKNLADYFSNMPWYKPNNAIKGSYSELNDTEKANYNLINSYYDGRKSSWFQVNKSQLLTEGSKKYWKQEVSRDLNQDGINEKITVKYYLDYEYAGILTFTNYQIAVQSNGKTYTINGQGYNTRLGIKFADFNIKDKYLQMYIVQDGPSADYVTYIYTFKDNKIVKSPDVLGLIDSYNGIGKIYTQNNTLIDGTRISYYDFENGFVSLPKKDLVNKVLTFKYNIPLLKKPDDNLRIPVVTLGSEIDWKDLYGDNLIKTVPKNTKFTITDVITKKVDSSYSITWLKVKTPTGEEGYINFIYGD